VSLLLQRPKLLILTPGSRTETLPINHVVKGMVAQDFSAPAIAAALLHEIARWDRCAHDPVAIAAHWRACLAPGVIADRWEALMEEVLSGRATA
jgi:hypothetical protein